jgi:4-hydroxy-tetrahydrodipicolinate synthase
LLRSGERNPLRNRLRYDMDGATMLLRGVVPANVLPFDDELAIDESGYRNHVDRLAGTTGIGGLTCNGHAGEVASLDRAERRRATAIAVEVVGGRIPVVCGIYSDDERDAADKAEDAEADGADALLVMPPNSLAYEDSLDSVLRHYSHIASKVALPLVVFVYPEWTGMQYGPELLSRLCNLDSVVAVKEWSLDIRSYERNRDVVGSANHPVALLTSFSTHLLPTLALGADGILSGHGSVIAAQQVELFDSVEAGDLLRARAIYGRIQMLTKVIYRDPMPNMYARMKEQLVMLGHELQPFVRAPLRPISGPERTRLRAALVHSGLLEAGDTPA